MARDTARVRRVPVKVDDEQKVLIGLIVNDNYCRQVLGMLRPEHLESRHARRIVQWVREFFTKYEKAPRKEIETIYRVHEPHLESSEAGIIQGFLETLSAQYEGGGDLNWDYQIDLARKYLRDRALHVLVDKVRVLSDRGDLEQAESAVRDFIVTGVTTSEWVWPLTDIELQRRVLEREEGDGFQLDGAPGLLFGKWRPGWLVTFVGPEKRGKTWWLGEVAMQAIVQGYRVAFFTMEMVIEDMAARFMRQATALPDQAGPIRVPVWDCAHNQTDECTLRVRTNEEPIPQNSVGTPIYDEASKYKPCTYCKDHPKKYLRHYKVASWFAMTHKGEAFHDKVISRTAAFAMQFNGGHLATRAFPRNSIGVDGLIAALDELETTHSFQPDIVVVDYADILLAEGREEERHKLDRIWKRLSALAQERKLLVVTASQAKSGSRKQRSVRQGDYAEDYRKGATVDLAIGLNQIDSEEEGKSEREAMVMRLSAMAVRHTATPDEEVYVLQNLKLGQPAMDTFARSVAIHGADDE